MIEKTTNYDMFTFREDNRVKIVHSHVKKISQSIQCRNLLELQPIIVNEKMEVLDGQHRLLAAKSLGLEIYYKIEKSCNFGDIILLNISKSWGVNDYLNYYCKNGFDEYIKLRDFSKKNQLQTRVAYNLCCARSIKAYDEFKEGKFKFSQDLYSFEIEICWRTIDFIKKMNGISPYTITTKFWNSLIKLITQPDFNQEKWMSNLSKMVERCCVKVSAEEYKRMFMEIYNWKNSHRVDLFS